ncbi:MAG: PhzF family phenazine biosynthesis protein [Streptomycetaceae bacterium]|nr:PhzF family phenazine biosynthesis protein [Streptomycetaceae bacterium]
MRIYVVDAFTDTPFSGNPAGVCLPDEAHAADAVWMQKVAAEMRHAETAFLVASDRDDADYDLRWFTPEVEVDLCGHATLASGRVLFGEGLAAGEVRFATRSGILVARELPEGRVGLDFPALPPREVPVRDGLPEMLGTAVVKTAEAGDDLLVEVASADAVRLLAPDIDALARLPYRCICVTAPSDPDGTDGVDFVSRTFGPAVGVPEDPVTGSTHCALGPYWAPRVGRTKLAGRQVSARGGVVGVEVLGERVALSGDAVLVLAGNLTR